jgi:hypothetical protein
LISQIGIFILQFAIYVKKWISSIFSELQKGDDNGSTFSFEGEEKQVPGLALALAFAPAP